MFCPLYSEARLAGEKRRDFSTELGKSTQNTPTSTKSEPIQSRLHYLPKVFSSESKVHNKWAKFSPFSPQKRPFVFRLIRSPIAADTGTCHRNEFRNHCESKPFREIRNHFESQNYSEISQPLRNSEPLRTSEFFYEWRAITLHYRSKKCVSGLWFVAAAL